MSVRWEPRSTSSLQGRASFSRWRWRWRKNLARRRGPAGACHHTAYYCVARYENADLNVWPSGPGLVFSGGIRPARFLFRLGRSHSAVGWRCLPGPDTWLGKPGNEHALGQQLQAGAFAGQTRSLPLRAHSNPAPAPRILSPSAHSDRQPLNRHRGASSPSCNLRFTSLDTTNNSRAPASFCRIWPSLTTQHIS